MFKSLPSMSCFKIDLSNCLTTELIDVKVSKLSAHDAYVRSLIIENRPAEPELLFSYFLDQLGKLTLPILRQIHFNGGPTIHLHDAERIFTIVQSCIKTSPGYYETKFFNTPMSTTALACLSVLEKCDFSERSNKMSILPSEIPRIVFVNCEWGDIGTQKEEDLINNNNNDNDNNVRTMLYSTEFPKMATLVVECSQLTSQQANEVINQIQQRASEVNIKSVGIQFAKSTLSFETCEFVFSLPRLVNCTSNDTKTTTTTTNIAWIEFNGCSLYSEAAEKPTEFRQAIKLVNGILCFSKVLIGHDEAKLFSQILKQVMKTTKLRELHLYQCHINLNDLEVLLEPIYKAATTTNSNNNDDHYIYSIPVVDFQRCFFRSSRISSGLPSLDSLQWKSSENIMTIPPYTLSRYQGAKVVTMMELIRQCPSFTNITEIVLDHNEIDDQAFTNLVSHLQKTNIRKLSIRSGNISKDGIQSLANAIASSSSTSSSTDHDNIKLIKLDLSSNQLVSSTSRNDGMESLTKVAGVVQELVLRNVNLKRDSLPEFLETVFTCNPKLTQLDITGNESMTRKALEVAYTTMKKYSMCVTQFDYEIPYSEPSKKVYEKQIRSFLACNRLQRQELLQDTNLPPALIPLALKRAGANPSVLYWVVRSLPHYLLVNS